MRGLAILFAELSSRQASVFVDAPTSRTVVIPHASHIFMQYSTGIGLPPRSSCVWPCRFINPGRTYLPAASISRSPFAGRLASPCLTATGSIPASCVIVSFSITISKGPAAGFPLPSTTIALRITMLLTRLPEGGEGAVWETTDNDNAVHSRTAMKVRYTLFII